MTAATAHRNLPDPAETIALLLPVLKENGSRHLQRDATQRDGESESAFARRLNHLAHQRTLHPHFQYATVQAQLNHETVLSMPEGENWQFNFASRHVITVDGQRVVVNLRRRLRRSELEGEAPAVVLREAKGWPVMPELEGMSSDDSLARLETLVAERPMLYTALTVPGRLQYLRRQQAELWGRSHKTRTLEINPNDHLHCRLLLGTWQLVDLQVTEPKEGQRHPIVQLTVTRGGVK